MVFCYNSLVSSAHQQNSLLIIGLTPSLLEKPVLWFTKNRERIINMRKLPSWWKHNTILIEERTQKKLSELLRQLTELGYQKIVYHPTGMPTLQRGEFLHHGSTITLYPVNEKSPWSIEFAGNTIDSLQRQQRVEYAADTIAVRDGLAGIKEGDYVVHLDHGIGIYRGLAKHAHVGAKQYFRIAYAPARAGGEPDMLFVPTAQKQKLALYVGFRIPQIHRLGTPLWVKTKKRAREEIVAFAKQLLASWKTRAQATRLPYAPDPLEQQIWMDFEHEETPSQQQTLEEIFTDMARAEPMDRLLVGDVGFGKTEVALRVALRACLNGKQVALLCPTTVLADQHATVFTKRFNALLNVVRYTRLESDKQIRSIRERAANGTVDIVIGTHRLLKSVYFQRLGLLIIDEEQRFGVRQKELLKERHPAIDILTCSATPIPRTLSLAISRIRPTSFLTHAPVGRMAPHTIVLPFDTGVLREAITRELAQNGQVYILANRIQTIHQTKHFLDILFPYVKKKILHGQLPEKDIVLIMHEFREGKFPLLISTTIIENGLDISNANTLIVENASRLGLAQCHQLRGRVGRGFKPSYAYFFYPQRKLTDEATKRLEALKNTQQLGAGLRIAELDLEIRGAGNILGKEQAGTVNTIGWNLYYQMLAEALEEMNNNEGL